MRHSYPIIDRTEWRRWVTPAPLREQPIHRWLVFPHSFTRDLVHGLIDEWGLDKTDSILDPFCGAGTTILAAKERNIPARGFDLSHFAVLATKVKTSNFDASRLKFLWGELEYKIKSRYPGPRPTIYSDLVSKALPGYLLSKFHQVREFIRGLEAEPIEKQFFFLALLSLLPRFSRAIPTGGWLKWIENGREASEMPQELRLTVLQMIEDVEQMVLARSKRWSAQVADSRKLPFKKGEKGVNAILS